MMTMRPPQQGHLSASALSGAVSIVGAAVASSSRAAGHTPRAIVDRFSNALAETLREPAIKSRIEAMQITMQIGDPDVQRKFLADQMKLWGPVVKEHNIKTDS